MRPDLILFDCDGVLIDSELLANRSDVDLLAELGIAFDLEEYMQRFVGKSAKDTVAGIEAATGRSLPEGFLERKAARVLEVFRDRLRPIPGIHEALAHLPMRRCVASSSLPERLEFTLGLTGLWAAFAPHVFSATMVPRGKPAPDLFLFAAERMGADPADCLVVEDSPFGVQAAVAAGMRAFGFVGGSHRRPGSADRLLDAGAALVFADMAQLPDLIA